MSASHLFNQTLASAQTFGSTLAAQSSQFSKQVGEKLATSSLSIGKQLTETVATHATGTEEHYVGSYHIVVKSRLAEGGFGFVDLVQDISTHTEYVMKRCSIARPDKFDVVKKEIKMLQQFKGPYVVELLGSEIARDGRGGQEALLLLAYCPGGHLLDRLKSRSGSRLPPANIYRIFGQIASGLKGFHEFEPPVTHRDLKLENILFGSDGNVRLCDFGSCVIGPVPLRNMAERTAAEEVILKETTQMYRAPEMIDLYLRDVLTEKTDIWALGCILFAISFLIHPFQDAGSLGILNGKFSIPTHGDIPDDIRALINRMLDPDPECRPNIGELYSALAELAAGRPLPPYSLTAEALQCRENRLAAAILKEQKQAAKQKPTYNAVPARKTAPSQGLDNNSVAAKRLAAKRGGQSAAQIATNISNESLPQPHASFEGFANFGAFETDPQQVGKDDFDANFTNARISASNNLAVSADDLFGDNNSNEHAVQSSNQLADDLFASPANHSFDSGDLFTSSHRPSDELFSTSTTNSISKNEASVAPNDSTHLFAEPESAFPAFESGENRLDPVTSQPFDFDAFGTAQTFPTSTPGFADFDSLFQTGEPVKNENRSSFENLAAATQSNNLHADLFGSSAPVLTPSVPAPKIQGPVDLLFSETAPQQHSKPWSADSDLLQLSAPIPPSTMKRPSFTGRNNMDPFASIGGGGAPSSCSTNTAMLNNNSSQRGFGNYSSASGNTFSQSMPPTAPQSGIRMMPANSIGLMNQGPSNSIPISRVTNLSGSGYHQANSNDPFASLNVLKK